MLTCGGFQRPGFLFLASSLIGAFVLATLTPVRVGSTSDSRELSRQPAEPLDLSHEREILLKSCGELCDMMKPGVPGKYFDYITKKVDCTTIFDAPPAQLTIYPPPKQIPDVFLSDYSIGGKVNIRQKYINQVQTNGKFNVTWTKSLIDSDIARVRDKRYGEMHTAGPHCDKEVPRERSAKIKLKIEKTCFEN